MAESEVVPVKVVLALIPRSDGKFVIIDRKIPHLHLRWAFPGGKTKPELHETEEEAVVREAYEEVRLNVRVVGKLLERKHPDTLVPTVYFHCELIDDSQQPEIGEEYEISRVEWVPAAEVLERFTSNVDPSIKDFVLSFNKDLEKEAISVNKNIKER